MGFSVGDIFSKNFLSAETIIGGKSKQESFAAEIVGVSGATVPTATFKQALSNSIPGSSSGISHYFKEKGSSTKYVCTSSTDCPFTIFTPLKVELIL